MSRQASPDIPGGLRHIMGREINRSPVFIQG
jgi:hypothetical protein